MSLNKEECIIIKTENYHEFDKLIKVISFNRIYVMIAKGVRKQNSKNRNGILLGSYSELEFFLARLNNKISRLKKAHVIKNIDILDQENLLIISELFQYINKIKQKPQNVFNAYLECINNFGKGKNFYIKTYIVNKTLNSLGLNVIYDRCQECNSNKNLAYFSFYLGGFKCKKHASKILSTKLLKSFYYLNHSYSEYVKNTNSKTNLIIYKELKAYIDDNIY